MRKLSLKQKKYIIALVQSGGARFTLTAKEKQTLESMNDYETLYQDAERFLNDVVFSRSCGYANALSEEWIKRWS